MLNKPIFIFFQSCCVDVNSFFNLSRSFFFSREPDPEGKLPEETLDASGLKQSFQTKGLS